MNKGAFIFYVMWWIGLICDCMILTKAVKKNDSWSIIFSVIAAICSFAAFVVK